MLLKYLFIISIIAAGLIFTSFAQNKSSVTAADQNAKIINYYPNPATSSINFELVRGYGKTFSIQLYNFMGKKVLDINKISPLTNLSLSSLYRGVYIFFLTDKNGIVVDSGKFQVIK